MTQPTFEEAKKCPKCDRPGEETRVQSAPDMPKGSLLHTIYCRTELCRWYNTCWLVTTNPDGSVPAPKDHSGEPKKYMNVEGHDQQAIDMIKRLRKDAERELEQGTEIRNPFSR